MILVSPADAYLATLYNYGYEAPHDGMHFLYFQISQEAGYASAFCTHLIGSLSVSLRKPARQVKLVCTEKGVLFVRCQALMQPSKQSVEEVKRVVSEARHKMQVAPQPGINGTFNEEDFMDGDLVDDMH